MGVVLLAGCGGDSKSAAKTAAPRATTTSSGDPGRDVIEAFVAAAHAARAKAMWGLLSTATKQRVGPYTRFRDHSARELAEGVGSFGRFRVIVSERITPEFGVVAIDGSRVAEGVRSRDVYAVALRLEGSAWRVELFSPVEVRPIGPDPGAHEDVVAQVAASVSGVGGAGTSVLYLDGHAESPKVYGTASNSTVAVDFEPALDPGWHTVVVFGSVGRNASATGWWFTVARKPKS